ncbi:hypothetical protein S40285_03847 [Stachybotrys chlorohalonatus IBT 40285]|uniref:Uncharacterized protein n=1 Tax=Stachybotrys chlorohalonatus (strain IBT 40285) TaxID=1283841 RepID=A0A084QLY3_STAC4|nr:hypothetical protein S40285_03847 [Stachybotrys chlorohalonata IBT 40285]
MDDESLASDDLLYARKETIEDELANIEGPDENDHRQWRGRRATIYDVVAGRAGNGRVIEDPAASSNYSKILNYSMRERPYAPEEVLFRGKHTPMRYEEYDIYHSHERDLPEGGRRILPDSDLLKSIHAYSSKFYEKTKDTALEGNIDECSMDETALIAFGILLEEAGKEVLGRRGDLVFTEPAVKQDSSSEDEESLSDAKPERSCSRSRSPNRPSKRRRVDMEEGF